MGSDTNELDTREDDKRRRDKDFVEESEEETMDATEVMEKIETVIERWQAGELDSEEALKEITTITDEL
jgi:DNA-binding transcriptional regulator YhcF (GntR family)